MYLLQACSIPNRALGTEDSMGIKIQSMPSCLESMEGKFKGFLFHFYRQQEASEGSFRNRWNKWGCILRARLFGNMLNRLER